MNNDTRKPLQMHEDDDLILTIRDRRRPKHFIIDNLIMDHWYPLIRETGYAIYSILTRMSRADNESSSVSFSFLCDFLDISRSALSFYITFLELCGLIYRDRPEIILKDSQGNKIKKKQGNRSNTYYILDIEPINHKTLEALRIGVEESETFSDDYRTLFTERILHWIPIQRHWADRRKSRIKTVVGQQALPFDNGNEPATPDESSAPEHASFSTHDLLTRIGIVNEDILTEFSRIPAIETLAFLWYTETERGLDPDRKTGYIITNLRKRTSAGQGFIQLATAWLEMDEEEREELLEMAFKAVTQNYAEELIREEYNFSDETIFALFKLGKSELEKWLH